MVKIKIVVVVVVVVVDTAGLRIEPGPNWWVGSALTTGHPALHVHAENQGHQFRHL